VDKSLIVFTIVGGNGGNFIGSGMDDTLVESAEELNSEEASRGHLLWHYLSV
jgi:hypothetical protein